MFRIAAALVLIAFPAYAHDITGNTRLSFGYWGLQPYRPFSPIDAGLT